MIGTWSADINQIESVFGLLGKTNSFCALASVVWAFNLFSSLESRVFDDIFVNCKGSREIVAVVFRRVASMVWFVNTIVPLITNNSFFKMTTNMAIINESLNVLSIIIDLLFWIEHVITLFAESHSFVLISSSHLGFTTCNTSVHGTWLAHSRCHLVKLFF